ncbi:hypothetical protein CERSUDRAFT_147409 [Gelatoporia subvermispora B]|uniref:TEL2-interacting protein 1 n=1 Tax=Ceriporiopsis subvermispora (strain B) TaxID=914234 RepID=M2RBZ5_CERS8|nr:hypothetical protein CERSUDRAFT_147409 [Gelatoporia subvermispora B]
MSAETPEAAFPRLKKICVPLMAKSLLTPDTIRSTSVLLTELIETLRGLPSSALTPSIASYVFFPLATLLRRNALSAVPDQMLEKMFTVLAILCETWWWDMDEKTWEQIFMLCGAVIGGLDAKGKGKVRDEESKEAAATCLWTLLHERDVDALGPGSGKRPEDILLKFRSHARNTQFVPVLGQTVDSLLATSSSTHLPLQRVSLRLLCVILQHFSPEDLVPTILPGVVSTMTKVILGTESAKGWAKGETVAAALSVVQEAIIRSIGDDVCKRHGLVQEFSDIEDLTQLSSSPSGQTLPAPELPYATTRSPTWLTGTASQLHIALNSLTSLLTHPTPTALAALASFSAAVLSGTTLTLPQSQTLLLSFLLSLSCSRFPTVADTAIGALRRLLDSSSNTRHVFLAIVVQISRDTLSSLPLLMSSRAEDKVEHAAGLIEAVCRIAISEGGEKFHALSTISSGVGKLLGPTGGIEKWGWRLLSVLEFAEAPVAETAASAARLALEADPTMPTWVSFPEVTFKYMTRRSVRVALESMFRSLGRVAGEDCLFAVEWFTAVGESGRDSRAAAALWCACRLLEGASHVSLDSEDRSTIGILRNRRIERFARGEARRVAEGWDQDTEQVDLNADHRPLDMEDTDILVEHVKEVVPIRGTVDFTPSAPTKHTRINQSLLHKYFSLQLLCVTAEVLDARFAPLLLHVLYPILVSLVSPFSFLSASALAALNHIAHSMSYASPANLLLANFDYALDAISRRLTRRWLDVDATKVLAVLVRLVGRDVVQKAGDVVEECFDRLDEFHGYNVLVDGLIEVLVEVVQVIKEDEHNRPTREVQQDGAQEGQKDSDKLQAFLERYHDRYLNDAEPREDIRDSAYPREAWGSGKQPDDETDQRQDASDPNEAPPASPAQVLTKQIISRSLFFLTHGSSAIRVHVIKLLEFSVPVLPESALLPAIHQAWPFILNRLSDSEPFIVSAVASLVETLAVEVGDFMYRRIWDDIWPKFRLILKSIDKSDSQNALARRGVGAVGTESAFTISHRLYKSFLRTMTAAVKAVHVQDNAHWEVLVSFRRFLHADAHEELQALARELYSVASHKNKDAVWLVLSATQGSVTSSVSFLQETKWDIRQNASMVLAQC